MALPGQGRAEWLEADGLGGFASGTTSGIRTRRYHALLLPAATPPAGRVVLVNGLEVWADIPGATLALSSQHYTPDVVHPDGVSPSSTSRPTRGRGGRTASPTGRGSSTSVSCATGRR